mmetsp:Transcript_2682/g.8238  ORF Transcript_2682/g.8238 Transcript_2682/m.8238 type:complete len:217 (+) Transcript_2682:1322-1972(+)
MCRPGCDNRLVQYGPRFRLEALRCVAGPRAGLVWRSSLLTVCCESGVPLPACRPHLQGVGHPQPRADPARLLRVRVRRRVHLRRRGGEPRHPVRQPKDESADGRVRKRPGRGPHVHRRHQVLERRSLPQPLLRAERLQAARVLRPPRAAAQDSLLRPRGHPASRGALLRLRVCGRAGQDHAMSLRRKELQKAAVLSAKLGFSITVLSVRVLSTMSM